MPIASGANGWPNSYFKGRPKDQGSPRMDRGRGYSPQGSPYSSKRLPSPEVVRYEEHVYDGVRPNNQSSSSSTFVRKESYASGGGGGQGGKSTSIVRNESYTSGGGGGQGGKSTSIVRKESYTSGGGGGQGGNSSHYETTKTVSSSKNIDSHTASDYYTMGNEGYGRYTADGKKVMTSSSSNGYWRTGPDGKRVWVSSTTQYDSYGRVVHQDGDKCCFFGGNDYYSTGVAGANTGCCQGGMFGGKASPYGGAGAYSMVGTGRKRCCACLIGLLLGLLLLGFLLGMLLGVKANRDKKSRESYVSSMFSGGYFLNGVYYYPVTNPPDTYYFAMGHLVPCNKYNNNSEVRGPTVSYEAVTEDATATAEVTIPITEERFITIPNCEDITTQYILAQNYTPTPTPMPILVAPSSANALHSPSLTIGLVSVICFCIISLLSQKKTQ